MGQAEFWKMVLERKPKKTKWKKEQINLIIHGFASCENPRENLSIRERNISSRKLSEKRLIDIFKEPKKFYLDLPENNLRLLMKHEDKFSKNFLKFFPDDIKPQRPSRAVKNKYNLDRISTDVIRRIGRSVSGVIGEGKEAIILHAYSEEPNHYSQYESVLKVFKLKARQGNVYLEKDERRKLHENHSFRKHSKLWAEKEKDNLKRMTAAGIPCPRVFRLTQNILVTSFIGEDGKAAPKLRDAVMTKDNYLDAYKQIIKGMELFHKAGLVHADLSENNVLWHNGRCYFIDASQSVTYEHKHALKFLYRDCTNITQFFSKKPILHQPTPNDLFYFITGQYYEIKARGKKGKKGKAERKK